MTENERTQVYFCTRPALVSELAAMGKRVEQTSNPFSKDRLAWLIPIDDEVADVVTAHYAEAGKPLPASVKRYLAERKERAANV